MADGSSDSESGFECQSSGAAPGDAEILRADLVTGSTPTDDFPDPSTTTVRRKRTRVHDTELAMDEIEFVIVV